MLASSQETRAREVEAGCGDGEAHAGEAVVHALDDDGAQPETRRSCGVIR